MTTFDKAFEILMGHEGGYVNNPADPGGETKFGISKRSYPTLDIKNLSLEEAKALYKKDYWDRIHGDTLPPALALLAFDAAVNNGPVRAWSWLDAVSHLQDTPAACAEFMALRLVFMASLKTWPTFGLGWSRRLCALPWQASTL